MGWVGEKVHQLPPSVMRINVGMLPCRSNKVCILTAALWWRNRAQGEQRQTEIDGGRIQGIEVFDLALRPEDRWRTKDEQY